VAAVEAGRRRAQAESSRGHADRSAVFVLVAVVAVVIVVVVVVVVVVCALASLAFSARPPSLAAPTFALPTSTSLARRAFDFSVVAFCR